ncbi:MAG: RdgB/HAM1 family non-canonical purine NTP pyrophosphatase [Myxococcaceae bacterium]|nr:RdgB/HAM1 family non-canonical purine NTP pyrophosphatase [Myxococcaceae bacterium]
MKLLFATRNRGKIAELQQMVGERFEIVSLDAFPGVGEVEETGDTFEANAILKARAYARATGLVALADDSGLSVDALGGRPGVHSARYVEGSDEDRVCAVLRELEGVPDGQRGGEFVCVLALATPEGEVVTTRGVMRGVLTRAPRGTGGFGYDPIFEIEGTGKTTAEMSREEKARISHRGQAFRAMVPRLKALAQGVWPPKMG